MEADSVAIKQLPAELIEQEHEPKKKLYLNGIYEYDYPYDTKDMNENQYIAFNKKGDSVRGWYFGTSDEFDEAREGYLPGYFVSKIEDLTIKGDSIFFHIVTGYDDCYSTRFPVGYIDTTKINEAYDKWFATGNDQMIGFSAKVDGLKLYLTMYGESRTYKKTRNYFHPGIDNYDSTKCRTEPLLSIHQNLEILNEKMVLDFLSTFSMICEANVEFSEWSNELLFKILSSEPELTLEVLSKNLNKLDTASIYEELESPLHDLIPIDSITSKIEPLNIDEELKKSVLSRLENLK
ncbi:MAG: hypothetical protein ABJN36_05135 [Cyclobacteriaceae bacterium]